MRTKKPKSVGEILKNLVRKTALGHQLEQARIWEWWAEAAGPNLAPHGRPTGIREQSLTVEVDSTVWINKFAYHKWDILKQINRRARHELISDIFLLLTPDEEPLQGTQAPTVE